MTNNIVWPTLIVFVNYRQYYKYINSKEDFYVLFELSSKNRKTLFNIIQDCIENTHFCGIIFAINKNEILLDRLFFLKDITLKLFKNYKQVGVWGIPYCVMQSIFGSYYFSQLANKMIQEDSNYYSKFTPFNQHNSSLLLSCSQCIASNKCDGFGSRKENQSMKGYRASHKYRKLGRDILFKTNNEAMQKMYKHFCDYIDSSDLRFADRYVYFVKNIDFGSPYSFSDRFVYNCDYLPLNDYEKELNFLNTYVENKSFLKKINQLSNEISKIAYSKAQNNGVVRESFYLGSTNEDNKYLLNYFNINLDIKFSHKLYGMGVDYYNGKIKSYKIYFSVSLETLYKIFPHYCEQIDIDILGLHQKQHYYTLRLNANKKIISERIELVYNHKDFLHYQSYFKHLLSTDMTIKEIYIIVLNFEFEKIDLKKINIYYRNNYNTLLLSGM